MVNNCVFIGNITMDFELRTAAGKPVCDLFVAVNRRYKKGESDFIKVTCWNQVAEYIYNYGGKGRLVCIEGSLRVEKYVNKHGEEQHMYSITASDVSLLDRGKDNVPKASAPASSEDYDPFQDPD